MSLAACRHIVYLESCEKIFFLPSIFNTIPADMIDYKTTQLQHHLLFEGLSSYSEHMANKSVNKGTRYNRYRLI